MELMPWVWVLNMCVSTGNGFGFQSLGLGSHGGLCFGGHGGLILDLWFWYGIELGFCE
jgi:hypothetical protein